MLTIEHWTNHSVRVRPEQTTYRFQYAIGDIPPRYPLPAIPIQSELFAPDSTVAFAIWYLEPLINPES